LLFFRCERNIRHILKKGKEFILFVVEIKNYKSVSETF
jgi:hypothetical protein